MTKKRKKCEKIIYSKNIPNAVTLKVFKDTEEGKNLIRCKDVNDLIEKLGLK